MKGKQASVLQLIEKELRDGRSAEEIVRRFRNCVMIRALELCDWNQLRAAALLKTHRNNLVRWIQEYKLERTENDRAISARTDRKRSTAPAES